MKTHKITKGILNPVSLLVLEILIGISTALYLLSLINIPSLVSLAKTNEQ
jgi:hypothetical protein